MVRGSSEREPSLGILEMAINGFNLSRMINRSWVAMGLQSVFQGSSRKTRVIHKGRESFRTWKRKVQECGRW